MGCPLLVRQCLAMLRCFAAVLGKSWPLQTARGFGDAHGPMAHGLLARQLLPIHVDLKLLRRGHRLSLPDLAFRPFDIHRFSCGHSSLVALLSINLAGYGPGCSALQFLAASELAKVEAVTSVSFVALWCCSMI